MEKVKIGETLYDMRVVKTYNGQTYEEKPLFNGFEGIVVCNTWDVGDWQVLKTWRENAEFITKEIGIIDDMLIQPEWSGKEVADFIKDQVSKILNEEDYKVISKHEVTSQEVRKKLLDIGIVAPRNVQAHNHISRNNFQVLTDKIAEYVNAEIRKSIEQLNQSYHYGIAIDEIIATRIKIHEERE